MAAIVQRKSRDGSISYFVRIRRRGAKTICASFARKTDAKLWILEAESAILDGRHFQKPEEKKRTLKEAIDRFKKEFTIPYSRHHQFDCWTKEIGHKLLCEITGPCVTEVISKWKHELNEAGNLRGPSTINKYLSSLSVVLTAATQDWGWCTRNICQDVRRQREPRGRTRYLSDEERQRLLVACANSYCPYIYLMVVLALSTGMRANEIRTLKWPDIHFDKGVLLLFKTKNKEPRRVPIRGLALDLFKEHAKVRRLDTDFVFPGEFSATNGRAFDPRKAWEDARRRAGLKDFKFHDLRHSCASYLAMNGASMLEIAEVLGHKTLQMVKRYSHLAESHTANVVEQMNKKIFG